MRARGVVVFVCLALTACSGAPEIESIDLDEAQTAACASLLDALPATLNGEKSVAVDPSDALGAAWGDPAIVLTCGVATPEDYDDFSPCEEANGVGWFVPLSQIEDQGADVTLTAVGFEPKVQLEVPADYRPEGVAAAITELAEPIKASLSEVNACT